MWFRHGLITLVEASRRWPHLARLQLYPLLAARPDLALHGGGAALAALAGIDPGLLERIESVLPAHRHIDLDIGIAAVAVRLAEHRLPEADPAGRAHIHDTLAVRLSNAGLHARALTEGQQATRIWRRLAGLNRAAYLPGYIQSLTVMGYVLVEGARFREAIDFLAEAFVAGQQLPEYAQGIIDAIVDLLRYAYAGDADGVSESFREFTGQDVPDWMKQPPAAED